jgi:amino-acid N-acetyltransferase
MSNFSFRTASPEDWQAVSDLLVANDLPLDGARDHLTNFIVAYQGDTLAGCAGLERYGQSGLLRSVATSTSFRGVGLGQELVRKVLDKANKDGIKDVVLLTTTADQFFPRFGFNRIVRETAPDAVKSSVEFQGACPDSAVTMQVTLA